MSVTATTDPFHMRFDGDTRERLRSALLRRGERLATALADVLAGKRVEVPGVDLIRPGKRPEEILREALDQTEQRRRLLVAGDDRYGRCDVCGVDLGVSSMEEMPWADRCAAHSAN